MSKTYSNSFCVGGIYKAILLSEDIDSVQVFIPAICNDDSINPINSNGTINETVYQKNKSLYPKCNWCAPNKEAQIHKAGDICWVVFDSGKIEFPTIVGYSGLSIKAINGGSNSSNSNLNFGGLFGTLTGGRLVDALFTAYYPTSDNWSSAENIIQGGPTAAYNDEPLDWTKNTCAAPIDIPFNTNIQVLETGTELDDAIYRVNDRGGAIKVENGVYHFDLLMKDKKTAYAWGKKYGKAMIGGTLQSNTNINSSEIGSKIVNEAQKYLGVPYVWGGTTPKGFDCSGFVQYVYKQIGINIPRSTTEQIKVGNSVDKSNLQPGDLVFYIGSNGSRSNPGHVGIYIGNGQMIHAPQTGDVVKISSTENEYRKNTYIGARRIK